ncbi:MarR family winged helix-turn-helix transcriptional regulator [bacterium RCC_150]
MSDDAYGEDQGGHSGSPAPFPDIERWPTGRLLSTAARLSTHAWNEHLKSADLTHAGFVALDVLTTTGPLTPSRLAQIVHVKAQTIGRILARLERHGYVTRKRNPKDRRLMLVTVTESGAHVLKQAVESEQQLLSLALDTQALRHDLKLIVRELRTPPAEDSTRSRYHSTGQAEEPFPPAEVAGPEDES